MSDANGLVLAVCGLAVTGGLVLLWRGIAGFRSAVRVGDTSTSRIASLAAGEVRITGTVEPAEVTLVSPLQRRECVWYRSRVTAGDDDRRLLDEERAIGFRVRDETGSIRVFPRGARIDGQTVLDERDSIFGERPASVSIGPAPTIPSRLAGDREAAIAALLTVRPAEPAIDAELIGPGEQDRRYVEARLEVGDVVTVMGTALPFGHLDDPEAADVLDGTGGVRTGLDDPEVAMNVAEGRAAGILLPPEEAWGNAAIPGFGIGRPVRPPDLEAGVSTPTLASAEEAAAIERVFDLEPDLLVLAARRDSPLLIAAGGPGEVVAREEGRFLLGLLGAVLAIGGAVGAAILVTVPR